MPPKRNPNKEKLAKQREKLAKAKKDREEKNEKLMKQMAAIQEKAERDLKRFKKMELQIKIDKNKKNNKKFEDLRVASKIAEALNKKDKDDDNFADDAIALLQELKSVPEKEEEGISVGALKSALRKKKSKSRKNKKDLLMKGKLKIWGDNPPSDLNFDGKLRKHGVGGSRKTRKKRGGDKYFDKHKKIIKDFLEHPEVAKKIKKYKKNKLSINQIMKKITRDKLNKIIKAYARYLKSQKGGKDPKELERLANIEINRPTPPFGTVPRPELGQPPQGEEAPEINFFQILDGVIRLTEAQERQARQNRNQQRRETRFNMVHSLVFSMFMLLTVFGLMRDTTNVDLENIPVMNVLGQGIIMAHQTGLLGAAQRIMLWDTYWSFFNNAWIPGGFTGEDLIVQRRLARFIAPFFPLPELRDDDEMPMPWEGGGSRPNSPQEEFADRISPPVVDPFVALLQHYKEQHNIFLNELLYDIWANPNRKLFQKIKKLSGTRHDNIVAQLMKNQFIIAHTLLVQNIDRLVNDYKNTIHTASIRRKHSFEQNTLIECFDTAQNTQYIGNLTEDLNQNHYLFFLYVLKFLQIGIGKNRSDSKLNLPSGNYEIDPIDCFVLLGMIISYYRIYRTLGRREVPQVFNNLCNTILQIHRIDLVNKNFVGWQRGGRKKTRKRRKKRKNRKKTRK